MISEIIIFSVVKVITFFVQYLPGAGQVPLLLPWGTDDIMIRAISAYKVLALSYPPFQTVLDAFVIYIGFRIIMKIIKVIPFVGNMVES